MRVYTLKYYLVATIGLSVILGMSTKTFIMFWFFLEVNMLAFLGYAMIGGSGKFSISPVKYFLIQTIGSAIFLGLNIFSSHQSNHLLAVSLLVCMLWKAGAAPFHVWYVGIVPSLPWDNVLILSTIQKLMPLWAIFTSSTIASTELILISALVIFLTVYSANSLKMILAFSSLFGMMWMICGMFSPFTFLLFFTMYSLSLMMMMIQLAWLKYESLADLTGMPHVQAMFSFFSLISMSGIPPFAVFLPKILILSGLIHLNKLFQALFLCFGSVYFVYIYSKLFIPMIGVSKLNSNFTSLQSINYISLSFLILMLLTLPLIAII